MVMRPASAPLLDQAPPREQIARRAGRRPRHAGMPGSQPLQEHPRAPTRMRSPGRTDEIGDVGRYAMRAAVWGAAAVTECGPTALVEAVEPLVAGLATDGVPFAELGHGVQAAPVISDEAFTFVHE